MKTLLRHMCALLFVACAASCTLLENKHQYDRSRHDTEGKDTTSGSVKPEAKMNDTIIYTAGVRFRDGYDWRLDTLAANEPRDLVFTKNGEVIATFPVSYDDAISDNPDMMRILDGHLYTDFSTPFKTIVKKDGQTLFSFDGRESFCGFLLDGNDIWTLGKDRDGERVIFLRKNGVLVFTDNGIPFGLVSDPSGEHGALTMTSSGPAFFYYKTVVNQEFKGIVFSRFVNGEATPISFPEKMTRFKDAKMVKGRPVIVGQLGTAQNNLTLYFDNHTESYSLTGFSRLGSCFVVPLVNGNFIIKGEGYVTGATTPSGFIIEEDRHVTYIKDSRRLIAFYEKDDVSVAVTCDQDGSALVINKNGWDTIIDGRFSYISRRCGYICGKRFYMALNPVSDGSTPFVVGGDKRLDLNYNGFVTDVWPSIVPLPNR